MSGDETAWQLAHPSARTSDTSDTSEGGHQRTSGRRQPPPLGPPAVTPVTHQIVTTSAPGLGALVDLVDDTSDDGEELTGRERMLDALSLLRFFGESPGSLRDQIEFAERGAYTGRPDGFWRTANIWYARTIAFIGLSFCYLLAWSLFTRLSRALTLIPVFLFVLWGLNHVPVTAWLVWDGLDFTMWFAPAEKIGGCLAPGIGE